jgi:hypothetical protein
MNQPVQDDCPSLRNGLFPRGWVLLAVIVASRSSLALGNDGADLAASCRRDGPIGLMCVAGYVLLVLSFPDAVSASEWAGLPKS